jgi:molecular chaperone GrpE
MDPQQEIDDLEVVVDDTDDEDSVSVDDFIRELEEKEKDLHITLETTVIEIEQGFDDVNPSVFTPTAEHSLEVPTPTSTEIEPVSELSVEDEDNDAIYELEEQIVDMEDQISALKQTIARLETERGELFKNSQRRAKDYEAYRARTERERTENLQNQAGDLATRLLPALDNLDRALHHAEMIGREKSPEFGQFFEGIRMVNEQIIESFAGMGIEPIPALGELFDPHLHEAVALEENSDYDDNVICEEMLKGYRLGERVLRHSMVKVASKNDTTPRADENKVDEAKSEPEETEKSAENSALVDNDAELTENPSPVTEPDEEPQ